MLLFITYNSFQHPPSYYVRRERSVPLKKMKFTSKLKIKSAFTSMSNAHTQKKNRKLFTTRNVSFRVNFCQTCLTFFCYTFASAKDIHISVKFRHSVLCSQGAAIWRLKRQKENDFFFFFLTKHCVFPTTEGGARKLPATASRVVSLVSS